MIEISSLYKRYTPGIASDPLLVNKGFWFVFCGDKLLVQTGEGKAGLPCLTREEVRQHGIQRCHYLGTLDGTDCYTGSVGAEQEVISGAGFMGLRALMNLLDEDIFLLAGRAYQILVWDETHRFCGRCGRQTVSKPDEWAKECTDCGHVSYPRISPAMITAVVREGQILLAHAKRFPDGLYSVLAGFVEPGETFEDCVRREVMEEVGIEVKNIRYFGSQPWPFPNSLMVAFTAEYAAGEICVDDVEIGSAAWFSPERLPQIPQHGTVARRLINWFLTT